jgi:hypothetical protein
MFQTYAKENNSFFCPKYLFFCTISQKDFFASACKVCKSAIVTSKVCSKINDTKNCVGLGWGIVKEELMGEVRIPKLYL